jgi:hypothetical protein
MLTTENRSALMARAWAIFRDTYDFPRIPFLSIGRRCFASALRMAWGEHRAAAILAAEPTEKLLTVVQVADRDLAALPFKSFRYNSDAEERRLSTIRRTTAAELARRNVAPFAAGPAALRAAFAASVPA